MQRCDSSGNLSDSGTYAKYTVNSTYSTVNGKNTRTVTAAYSSDNGSTYSAETTLQATTDTAGAKTGTYGGGSLASTTSYVIRFTIKDAYGATATITSPLQSAARPMNIKSNGKGVAFGKMAETDNLLDVSWGARIRGNLSVDGTETVTGNTTLNGTLTVAGATTVNNSLTTTDLINSKGSINMGGLNGQTGELNIRFSNPTTSTNPHNVYFYGGSPSAAVALGVYDARVGKNVVTYNDTNDSVNIYTSTININSNKLSDFVVEQGTSGIWTYRKWNSGIAECWGIYTMSSSCTLAWGTLYYSNKTCSRINYPFTFTSRPQETVSLRLDSYSGWIYADSEGKGMNTTTQTAVYGFLRPSTMGETTVRYEFTVIGKWK